MTKKAMVLEEYSILELQQQLDLLYKDGVHVGKQVIGNQVVILYQLNNFYVEVVYKDYRRVVESIIASNDMKMLQPYLGQIKIEDLDSRKE